MAFNVVITPRKNQSLNEIFFDVVSSASYYKIKDMEVVMEKDSIIFYHPGQMPVEEYSYLTRRYNSNLSVLIDE